MEHVDAFIIFAKVGDLESISGAARTLGLPKANVSRAVMRLEALYKVPLLDRSAQKVTLTEIGRTLHRHCQAILEQMAEVDAEIAAHRGLPTGILRIGCPGEICSDLLTPYLHKFMAEYPDIDLRVRVGERLLPQSNKIDLVIHSGWLSDSNLIARKVADIETILVASRDFVDAHGSPQSIDELANYPVIGNFYLDSAATEVGELPAHVPILELIREGERYPVPIWKRFASTDHRLALSLVRKGMAIAPIAKIRVIEELANGEVIRILPDFEIHNQASLYVIYADRSAMAPKIEVFIKFIFNVVSEISAGQK